MRLETKIIRLAGMLDQMNNKPRPPLVTRLPLIMAIRKLDAHVKIALKELEDGLRKNHPEE